MADKKINELPVSSGLTDDALLPVYQNDQTKSITGALVKSFAVRAAQGYADTAQQAAKAAAESANKAESALGKGPYIDETTKTWFVWDANQAQFVDTGVKAEVSGGGSGGISKDSADLLIKILRSAIYTENQSENIKSLAEKLGADDQGGGEPGGDGTLPENGLLALFDMRNITPDIDDRQGLTTVKPTKGSGQFYAWSATAFVDASDYGSKLQRGFLYSREGGTTQTDLGENWSTVILTAMDEGVANSLYNSGFVKLSNIVLSETLPTYKTASGEKNLQGDPLSKPDSSRYTSLSTVVDGEKLKLYINGELKYEYDGSSIDDFVRWNPIGTFSATALSRARIVCAVIYDRSLTDVEVVDAHAYMETLEVI